mmetsp:Transcript_4035/g.7735  ORF Transcript_4035/g.7735 Transcript_4035/m.7735 type:complete len:204 (-) Transcript_4035:251-862(-)
MARTTSARIPSSTSTRTPTPAVPSPWSSATASASATSTTSPSSTGCWASAGPSSSRTSPTSPAFARGSPPSRSSRRTTSPPPSPPCWPPTGSPGPSSWDTPTAPLGSATAASTPRRRWWGWSSSIPSASASINPSSPNSSSTRWPIRVTSATSYAPTSWCTGPSKGDFHGRGWRSSQNRFPATPRSSSASATNWYPRPTSVNI